MATDCGRRVAASASTPALSEHPHRPRAETSAVEKGAENGQPFWLTAQKAWTPALRSRYRVTTKHSRNNKRHPGGSKNLGSWPFDNQSGICFNLITLLFLTHMCLPKARPYTRKFFTLGHHNARTGAYALGFDIYLMSFLIVLFTGLCAGLMKHLFSPLSKSWGIVKRKYATRFAEQAWLVLYCGVSWPLGTYIYSQSSYFLNLKALWINLPERELSGLVKTYVLAQLSFWILQLLVVHIEEGRKDYWRMMTHHVITILLVGASYAYHQTKVGNLIMILMDVVEFFLALAKCLKYLGLRSMCDMVFGVFVISWFLARHVFYLAACWSLYVDLPRQTVLGCYSGKADSLRGPFETPAGLAHLLEPFYRPDGIVCFSKRIRIAFLGCLLILQALTIMWFVLIIRVAVRVLKGRGADDVRSSDEDDVEAEEGMQEVLRKPETPALPYKLEGSIKLADRASRGGREEPPLSRQGSRIQLQR